MVDNEISICEEKSVELRFSFFVYLLVLYCVRSSIPLPHPAIHSLIRSFPPNHPFARLSVYYRLFVCSPIPPLADPSSLTYTPIVCSFIQPTTYSSIHPSIHFTSLLPLSFDPFVNPTTVCPSIYSMFN